MKRQFTGDIGFIDGDGDIDPMVLDEFAAANTKNALPPEVIGRLVDQGGTSKDNVIDVQVTSAACPRNHYSQVRYES